MITLFTAVPSLAQSGVAPEAAAAQPAAAPTPEPESIGATFFANQGGDLGKLLERKHPNNAEGTFEIQVQQLPKEAASLSVSAYDLDEERGETNKVYFNDKLIGTLSGTDNQWNSTVFDLPLNLVRLGANEVRFVISDRSKAGSINWSGKVGSGQIRIDGGASDKGAAYVFLRTSITWAQEAYLKAPNAETDDQFGGSVSVSGNIIAVGAQYEDCSLQTSTSGTSVTSDNSATFAGAVYVFSRSGTTWTHSYYIKAPNAEASDLFGIVELNSSSLLVSAVNEDSSSISIVNGTTASSDNSAANAGAGYIFLLPQAVAGFLPPAWARGKGLVRSVFWVQGQGGFAANALWWQINFPKGWG